MTDLGYAASTSIAQLRDVLISEPIAIISAEGASVLRESVHRLRESENDEPADVPCTVIRGAAYRSALIRAFCLDDRLAAFVGRSQETKLKTQAFMGLPESG
jgi:hypothetical protein